MTDQLIYLIEARMGALKIGVSADPKKRLREMSRNSPSPLRLIATWPGKTQDERELHARFVQHRTHNEGFLIAGTLRDFVEAARGVGVEAIPEWEYLATRSAADNRKAGREAAAAKLRAMWADDEQRAFQMHLRRRPISKPTPDMARAS